MSSHVKKIAQIDSLRGIAILLVVLVHTAQSVPDLPKWAFQLTKYGQLGVQLFFVVSAITLSISSDQRSGETRPTAKFFIRRFFRIAPLYYIGIIWYWAFYSTPLSIRAGMWTNAPNYTPLNLLTNFLFVHGFYPPAHNYVVPGGWSIGTEMAFYACFPLLFILFQKMSRGGALRFTAAFFSLAALYYALEYAYALWASAPIEKNNFMYYNLLNQLPVFALGLWSYFLSKNHRFTELPIWAHLICFAFFSWATRLLWTIDLPIVNSFMLLPFTAGAAFVFLYHLFAKIRWLNFEFLQSIGRVSYSMYIFHFVFAWFGVEYLHARFAALGRPLVLFGLYYLGVVALAYLVAVISEKYIEQPGIQLGKKIIQTMDSHP
ncbi:MAG: acyltransferase [Anaerolineales bacterium]